MALESGYRVRGEMRLRVRGRVRVRVRASPNQVSDGTLTWCTCGGGMSCVRLSEASRG